MHRTVEKVRKKIRQRFLPPLPDYYGRHPNPKVEEKLDRSIPGGVQKPTKRETIMRQMLRADDEKPDVEQFDKLIQVFANRARQEIRWLSVQRREFIRRAKRWATETILQGLSPSTLSLRTLLMACASTGDVSGAMWWFNWAKKQGRKLGRVEYNAVIGAYATEGQPGEAQNWLDEMREAGIDPDARSYASVVEAWEKLGNRQRMLQAILDMQRAQQEGRLGEAIDPRDESLPYIAAARSYAKVADTARAISLLKTIQVRGLPITTEVHKVRLEAHLKVPLGPRRSTSEIDRALYDMVSSWSQGPRSGPLYPKRLAILSRQALGAQRYKEILDEFQTTDQELIADLPGPDATLQWRRAAIQAVMQKRRMRSRQTSGKTAILGQQDDEKHFRKRLNIRRSAAQLGEIQAGYRMAGQKGLPEWMVLKKPEKYG